jgi:hypothetical protein
VRTAQQADGPQPDCENSSLGNACAKGTHPDSFQFSSYDYQKAYYSKRDELPLEDPVSSPVVISYASKSEQCQQDIAHPEMQRLLPIVDMPRCL